MSPGINEAIAGLRVSFAHYDLDISIGDYVPRNHLTTSSARVCHPSRRYNLLPICPCCGAQRWRCCQSNANSSPIGQLSRPCPSLAHHDPPLGECGRAAVLVAVVDEVAFLAEVIVDLVVD